MENQNQKKIFIGLLILLTLVIAIIILKTVGNQSIKTVETNNVTSEVKRDDRTTPPYYLVNGQTELSLLPLNTKIAIGEEFTLDLFLKNLDAKLVATDILLKYDSELLEFVELKNTAADYPNRRVLPVGNNQLLLSFTANPDVLNKEVDPSGISQSIELTSIVFKAKKAGSATVSPIIEATEKSSLIFLEGKDNNQLGKTNNVQVEIQ